MSWMIDSSNLPPHNFYIKLWMMHNSVSRAETWKRCMQSEKCTYKHSTVLLKEEQWSSVNHFTNWPYAHHNNQVQYVGNATFIVLNHVSYMHLQQCVILLKWAVQLDKSSFFNLTIGGHMRLGWTGAIYDGQNSFFTIAKEAQLWYYWHSYVWLWISDLQRRKCHKRSDFPVTTLNVVCQC